jgi:3D (Asp-Asp-Asp) domain-containing protein
MKTLILSAVLCVTATVYNAVPEQTNEDPGHTASMYKIDLKDPYKHRIIAVSRDLYKLGYKFGTKVQVNCDCLYEGVWTVRDLMNKKYKKRIDFLINEDMPIGKWDKVEIIKLK